MKIDTLIHQVSLSQREQEIAYLLVLGVPRKEIAERLQIAPETLKTHIAHVAGPLRLTSIVELVRFILTHPECLAGFAVSPGLHPDDCKCGAPFCWGVRYGQRVGKPIAVLPVDPPVVLVVPKPGSTGGRTSVPP